VTLWCTFIPRERRLTSLRHVSIHPRVPVLPCSREPLPRQHPRVPVLPCSLSDLCLVRCHQNSYGLEDKLDGVDEAMELWAGREDQMRDALQAKYQSLIEDKLWERFEKEKAEQMAKKQAAAAVAREARRQREEAAKREAATETTAGPGATSMEPVMDLGNVDMDDEGDAGGFKAEL
jgi:hypothetical protein